LSGGVGYNYLNMSTKIEEKKEIGNTPFFLVNINYDVHNRKEKG